MIEVVITACSILFSGPIDSYNSAELKNGTCREFYQELNPEFTQYGEVDNPISFDQISTKEISAAECQHYGMLAIVEWKKKNPSAYVNKWRCDSHPKRDTI